MEILSLTTSTILAQDSKNWPICMERNQILTTRWRHPLRLPHCHRSRGVRKFLISRHNCLTILAENLSCLVLTKKEKPDRICLFLFWIHIVIYHVRFDRNYCYYFPFLYKKNTIQLVKDLKLHKKNLLPSQICRAAKMVGNVSFKWLVLNLAFLIPLPCLFLEERKKNHKMAALF